MKYSHTSNKSLGSVSLNQGQLFKIDGNVYVVRKSVTPFPVVCQKLHCFDPFDKKNPEKNCIIFTLQTKIDED